MESVGGERERGEKRAAHKQTAVLFQIRCVYVSLIRFIRFSVSIRLVLSVPDSSR